MFFTQTRFILAGDLQGVRDIFGGIGAQRTNFAQIALAGLTRNQETTAAVLDARNADWQQLARDRRDITKVAHRLSEPYQPRIPRVVAALRF